METDEAAVKLLSTEAGIPQSIARFLRLRGIISPDQAVRHLSSRLESLSDPMLMKDMDRALELNPGEALVYYNRGLLYERLNSMPDAINEFSTAISLDPYRFVFYEDRGKAYVWMRNFYFAELDFSKAIDLDPYNAGIWFRRSLVRVSQEKFEEGLEDAFMARKLGYQVEEEYIRGLSAEILKDEL